MNKVHSVLRIALWSLLVITACSLTGAFGIRMGLGNIIVMFIVLLIMKKTLPKGNPVEPDEVENVEQTQDQHTGLPPLY